MRITRGTGIFCVVVGALIFVLWAILLATGMVDDLAERPTAYAFHLTAEALTAVLLLGSGLAIFKSYRYAGRLFYFAGGMLLIAALGMLVFYIQDGFPPFIGLGGVVVALTVLVLRRNYVAVADLAYLSFGTVLYMQLNVLGNLLQTGDIASAWFVAIAMAVTVPVALLAFQRPL